MNNNINLELLAKIMQQDNLDLRIDVFDCIVNIDILTVNNLSMDECSEYDKFNFEYNKFNLLIQKNVGFNEKGEFALVEFIKKHIDKIFCSNYLFENFKNFEEFNKDMDKSDFEDLYYYMVQVIIEGLAGQYKKSTYEELIRIFS